MPCYTHKMAIVFVAVDFVTSFHHICIRVLFSGTLFKTLDLENFATAYRSSKRAIDLSRQRWTHAEHDKPNSRQSVDNTYELRRSTANLSQWSSNSVYILQKRFRRDSLTSTTNSLLCNSTADDCPLISKIFCLQHDEIKISAAEMFPCPSIER